MCIFVKANYIHVVIIKILIYNQFLLLRYSKKMYLAKMDTMIPKVNHLTLLKYERCKFFFLQTYKN